MRTVSNESEFLPNIITARHYETGANAKGRTRQRKAEWFETSIYTTDGGFLHLNGETYPIRKGYVRFTRPGDIVSSTPPFKCMTVTFDSDIGTLPILESIPAFFKADDSAVRIYERTIEQYTSNDMGSKILMNSYVLRLIYELYRLSAQELTSLPAVNKCIEYMQKHSEERITLDKLGEISGYAPLYILRLFKKSTGRTPHTYLTDLRISRAKRMLENTEETVAAISAKCGFCSVSHFQVLFKDVTGLSPAKYRKNCDM